VYRIASTLVFLVQFGSAAYRHEDGDLLAPLAGLVVAVLVAALTLPVLGILVPSSRRALRGWRGRRRRRREAVGAERRALAMMGELCPHGWGARITLKASGDGLGDVELEWTEFADDSGRPAVSRRIHAATIGDALDAMVADRRTDEALEEIERRATDEAAWPDP